MSVHKLRSRAWFEGEAHENFVHRSWLKAQGHPDDMFDGRPVIGICNTWSDLTPCNAHLRLLAERVKRGVYEAGGFPLEFPVTSLGEPLMRPSTMMFRNLVAMDVEESIRANPLDGVVLLVGCDKTTPALLMGAASCNLPTLAVSGGPMLNGKYRGRNIGSGTQLWRFVDDLRAGTMTQSELNDVESCMSRSWGHCMTMGTASTLAALVEALGIGLPQNAAIPAADARRMLLAHMAGRRIVQMVREDMTMTSILTRESFENAITTCAAIGGSTNAVVHLIAIAGRLGIELTLEDWHALGERVPCLLNLMPSGDYLMEEFFYAGGLPALLKELAPLLHVEARTANGRTLGENIREAPNHDENVIRPLHRPVKLRGGIAILRGNLAERGAVIKVSAATPALMEHRARAVVFEDVEDLRVRIDDSRLNVFPEDILVLRNCGPVGYPGFPEVGNFPIPRKLVKRGVRDMVRISDARMSGTAYGTIVLHVAPESAVGGTLALVQTGDIIELSVRNRLLQLDIASDELRRRRSSWRPPGPRTARGYAFLYERHVLQADEGADFDFLKGGSGAPVPKPST